MDAPVAGPSPLLVDLYEQDLNGKPDLDKLIAAGYPWCGIILKATQGDYYSGGAWFMNYWKRARLSVPVSRYGKDWFRGAYHYLDITRNAKVQAQFFLAKIQDAGGWGVGDLWPMVDIEASGNPAGISAAQIVACASEWSEVILRETGRRPILYGGNYLAEHGITDHCGCQLLIVARYTATLPRTTYERIGWPLDKLYGWQYAGAPGGAYLAGYPKVCPMGATDITVLTIANGTNALEYTRSHLFAENPTP